VGRIPWSAADAPVGLTAADHLFNLEQGLRMYDAIAERIAVYECEIQNRMKQLTPPGRMEQQPRLYLLDPRSGS
jgi:hypothetical protein